MNSNNECSKKYSLIIQLQERLSSYFFICLFWRLKASTPPDGVEQIRVNDLKFYANLDLGCNSDLQICFSFYHFYTNKKKKNIDYFAVPTCK